MYGDTDSDRRMLVLVCFRVVLNVTGANRFCPNYPLVTIVPSSHYLTLEFNTDSSPQLCDRFHSSRTTCVALESGDSFTVSV